MELVFIFFCSAGGVFMTLKYLKTEAALIAKCGRNNILEGRILSLTMRLEDTSRRTREFELMLMSKKNALGPSMVNRLIALCRPDKHNNSKAATEVTQWLLEQR